MTKAGVASLRASRLRSARTPVSRGGTGRALRGGALPGSLAETQALITQKRSEGWTESQIKTYLSASEETQAGLEASYRAAPDKKFYYDPITRVVTTKTVEGQEAMTKQEALSAVRNLPTETKIEYKAAYEQYLKSRDITPSTDTAFERFRTDPQFRQDADIPTLQEAFETGKDIEPIPSFFDITREPTIVEKGEKPFEPEIVEHIYFPSLTKPKTKDITVDLTPDVSRIQEYWGGDKKITWDNFKAAEQALRDSQLLLFKQRTADQTKSMEQLSDLKIYEDVSYKIGEFERREWGKVTGTGLLTFLGVSALGQAIPAIATWKIPVISKLAKFTISPFGGKIVTGLWGTSLAYRGYQQAEYFKEDDWYRGLHGLSMLGAEMVGVAGASKWLTATKGKPYTKLWKDTYVKYVKEPKFTKDINAWMKTITDPKFKYLEKRGFLKIKGKPQRDLFGKPISQKRIRDLRQFVDPGYYGMDTGYKHTYDRTFVQRHLKDIYKVKAIDWRQQKVIDLSPKKMDRVMRQMLTAEPLRFAVIDKLKLETPYWQKIFGKHIPGYPSIQTKLITTPVKPQIERPYTYGKKTLEQIYGKVAITKTGTKQLQIQKMIDTKPPKIEEYPRELPTGTSMILKHKKGDYTKWTSLKEDRTTLDRMAKMFEGITDVKQVVISTPPPPKLTTIEDYGDIFGMISGGAALAGTLTLDLKRKDWTKEFSRDFGETSTDTAQAQKQDTKLSAALDQEAKQAAKQAARLSQYLNQIPKQIPKQVPKQIPRQRPKVTTIPKIITKQIPKIIVIPKIPTPTPQPRPKPEPIPKPKPLPFVWPTFKFPRGKPLRKKKLKKKAWKFTYSPSLVAGLKRITAPKIPKRLTGLHLRPVIRRKKKSIKYW